MRLLISLILGCIILLGCTANTQMHHPVRYTTATSGAPTIQVSEISHKVIQGPDADSELLVSIKATVANLLETEQYVKISIRAIDSEGFEVKDVILEGKFTGHQTRVLSETGWVSERSYHTIVRWELEE